MTETLSKTWTFSYECPGCNKFFYTLKEALDHDRLKECKEYFDACKTEIVADPLGMKKEKEVEEEQEQPEVMSDRKEYRGEVKVEYHVKAYSAREAEHRIIHEFFMQPKRKLVELLQNGLQVWEIDPDGLPTRP